MIKVAKRDLDNIKLTNSSDLLKKYSVEKNNGTHLFCSRKKIIF